MSATETKTATPTDHREQYANWLLRGYTPWQSARLTGATRDPGRAAVRYEAELAAATDQAALTLLSAGVKSS
jgi:hypothetical protein